MRWGVRNRATTTAAAFHVWYTRVRLPVHVRVCVRAVFTFASQVYSIYQCRYYLFVMYAPPNIECGVLSYSSCLMLLFFTLSLPLSAVLWHLFYCLLEIVICVVGKPACWNCVFLVSYFILWRRVCVVRVCSYCRLVRTAMCVGIRILYWWC